MPTKLAEHHIQLPQGTTAQRPASPASGMLRYNSDSTKKAPEYYNGSAWIPMGKKDGSSAENAADSGFALHNQYPALTSGYYWIQSPKMTKPLQMYVDMTEDGGGYDFYPIQGGMSGANRVVTGQSAHSGRGLGLELWIPRSKYCWRAAANYVKNVLGETGANYSRYFNVIPVFRTNSDWSSTGGDGKNYTGYIMRDPTYYGTGAPDWRVTDGGRWWLRDTTHGEPNGDYNNQMFLSNSGYGIAEPYALADIGFNDGAYQSITSSGFILGSYYLVSTNAKP